MLMAATVDIGSRFAGRALQASKGRIIRSSAHLIAHILQKPLADRAVNSAVTY